MNIGVYNRYWRTAGGGEKVAGAIAETLAARGPVALLSHDEFDPGSLAERLGLDLSQASVRIVGATDAAVREATADLDLLVNTSFMSTLVNPCPHGIYYVHFPSRLRPALNRSEEVLGPLVAPLLRNRPSGYRWGEGFHAREPGRRSPIWTTGCGTIELWAPAGRDLPVELVFGFHRPPQLGPAEVRVSVDGSPVADFVLPAHPGRIRRLRGLPVRFTVAARGEQMPVTVSIESPTFVPADLDGGSDRRQLGVSLLAVRFGKGLTNVVGAALPGLVEPTARSDWIDSYDLLLANSRFTRGWVTDLWGSDAEVLHPPVTMFEAAQKERIILGVGRFFAAEAGHSKKQLELVDSFRRLLERGATGWELHLAGGCAAGEEDYFEAVRAAAADLPVRFHVNASHASLASLYGRASIYWHAAGYGEDPRRHPDRFEHFGITTAEAMSAGAVPVVINRAGQVETVRHGVDGFRFERLGDLVELTELLIAEPERMRRFSESARQRARAYSTDEFRSRLLAHVDEIIARDQQ